MSSGPRSSNKPRMIGVPTTEQEEKTAHRSPECGPTVLLGCALTRLSSQRGTAGPRLSLWRPFRTQCCRLTPDRPAAQCRSPWEGVALEMGKSRRSLRLRAKRRGFRLPPAGHWSEFPSAQLARTMRAGLAQRLYRRYASPNTGMRPRVRAARRSCSASVRGVQGLGVARARSNMPGSPGGTMPATPGRPRV